MVHHVGLPFPSCPVICCRQQLWVGIITDEISMEISQSFPSRCMRCLYTGRAAPDLEMNGVKVEVQHSNLIFHLEPVLEIHREISGCGRALVCENYSILSGVKVKNISNSLTVILKLQQSTWKLRREVETWTFSIISLNKYIIITIIHHYWIKKQQLNVHYAHPLKHCS